MFDSLLIPGYHKLVNQLLEDIRLEFGIDPDKFRAILEDGKMFEFADNQITDHIIDKEVKGDFLKNWLSKTQNNQGAIVDMHEEFFTYYYLFVNSCYSIFNNITKQLRGKSADLEDFVILGIYGTLCGMSDEIGVLLTNGYTKSALVLWRTFYEHTVIGIFLMRENDTELFRSYVDFGHRDVQRKKDSYDKHREELNFPELDPEKSSAIAARSEELKKLYGRDFEGEFAWAKKHVVGKPSFHLIEEKADMKRYRPFYIWASSFSHSNFDEISRIKEPNWKVNLGRLTAQETEKQSFIDPAQLTLSIFFSFNSHFLNRCSMDADVNILLLKKMYERMLKS